MLQHTARFFVFATRHCKLHATCTTSTLSLSKSPPSWARVPMPSVSSNSSPSLVFAALLLLHGLPCWLSKCAASTLSHSTPPLSSSTSASPHTMRFGLRSVSDLSTSFSPFLQSGRSTRSDVVVSFCSPSLTWLGHCSPRDSASGSQRIMVLACR